MKVEMDSRFPLTLFELRGHEHSRALSPAPDSQGKNPNKTVLAMFASYEQTPTPEPHPSASS